MTPVINATGVLLHTNLGRATYPYAQQEAAATVELDLTTGERGSRQTAVGGLFARLCEAEAAIVVNNNAAAVLLVLATVASGRPVAVSRGESVEIGGSFRVPEVMEQSGARLVDVGTTNRTRLSDYEAALARHPDMAAVLKVHPSNYRVDGFTESVDVAALAALDVPVVVDIGSGLLDARCPWLPGRPPAWLEGEPAAVQTLAAGASLVTFSGDKLLGGPQAGHHRRPSRPRRAMCSAPVGPRTAPGRPRSGRRCSNWRSLTSIATATRSRSGGWRPCRWTSSRQRAERLATRLGGAVTPVPTRAVPGAGSAPGCHDPFVRGGRRRATSPSGLRGHSTPVIARVHEGTTVLDLRAVEPADDAEIAAALAACVHQ